MTTHNNVCFSYVKYISKRIAKVFLTITLSNWTNKKKRLHQILELPEKGTVSRSSRKFLMEANCFYGDNFRQRRCINAQKITSQSIIEYF